VGLLAGIDVIVGKFVKAGYTLRPIKEALTAQAAFSVDASHELRASLAVSRLLVKNCRGPSIRCQNLFDKMKYFICQKGYT
jgi:hypothetical protein